MRIISVYAVENGRIVDDASYYDRKPAQSAPSKPSLQIVSDAGSVLRLYLPSALALAYVAEIAPVGSPRTPYALPHRGLDPVARIDGARKMASPSSSVVP